MWRIRPGAGAASRTSWPLRGSSGSASPAPRGERRAPRPGREHDGAARAIRSPPAQHAGDRAAVQRDRRRPRSPRAPSRRPPPPRAPARGRSPAGRTGGRPGTGSRRAPRPVSSGSSSRTSSAPTSRAPGDRDARASRAGSAAHVAASGCTISAPLRRIRASSPSRSSSSSYSARPGARELQLGPGVLVGAEHVALAEAGRPARHRAAVEQRHRHAADGELARDRRADDAGADHHDVAHSGEAGGERVLGVEQVLAHRR